MSHPWSTRTQKASAKRLGSGVHRGGVQNKAGLGPPVRLRPHQSIRRGEVTVGNHRTSESGSRSRPVHRWLFQCR